MLTTEFFKWILAANLIAWPMAYLILNTWLKGFAYRIPIQIGTFVLASVLAIVVALFTLSFQTIRASLADPSQSLRYE